MQELEKLRSEKQLIKLQFAREIEAAQVQLGERESQFISEHLETLQQLQKEKQQGNTLIQHMCSLVSITKIYSFTGCKDST